AGPRGVGKTTSARILAKALNCEQGPTPTPCGQCRHCVDIALGNDLDVIEIDAASNTGVDNIRDLRERIIQAPFASRYKVYIIDEIHMLSTGAFNALLKTLEEPPPNVVFIFATTEIDKVPETIRSRCVVHAFRRLSAEDIVRRLEQVAAGEGMQGDAATAREIFGLIARSVEGGMRDALVLFDQLLALTEGKPDVESALKLLGLADRAALAQTVGWLAAGDAPALLGLIEDLVERGRNLERFVKSLTAYLRDLMLLQADAGEGLVALSGEALDAARQQAAGLSPATLFNFLNQMFELEERLKQSGQARFLLEFTFLRMAAIKPVVPLDKLINRVGALPDAAFGPSAPAAAAQSSAGPVPPADSPPARPACVVEAVAPVPPAPRASVATPPSDSDDLFGGAERRAAGAAFFDSIPERAPAASPAACPQAAAEAVSASADNPLSGLAPAEIIGRLIPQLPDCARFLSRYLRQAAIRFDQTGVLRLAWPPEAALARRMIERADNLATLEAGLASLCGQTVRLRSDTAAGSSEIPGSIASSPTSAAAASADPPAHVYMGAPGVVHAGAAAPARVLADSEPSPQPPLAQRPVDESRIVSPPADEDEFTDLSYTVDSDAYAAAAAATRPLPRPRATAASARPGPAPAPPADRRTALEKAQAFLKVSDDAAKRVKMLRDMLGGRVIDENGQPLAI
ncbi:MAG: DNA polymerase III subunit gamma/tau, partial [bacterium]|nr:DNA polymerase III subunit gamma/tau [bacterium]